MEKNLLVDLKITKVSFVPAGADDEAHILIVKSKETEGGNVMSFEEILKGLKPEDAQVIEEHLQAEITKSVDTAKEEIQKSLDEMTAAKDAAESKVTALEEEVAKAKEAVEPSEEEILKSVSPEIRAYLEKQKAQVAASEAFVQKMKAERLDAEAVAKAKTIDKIGVPEEEIVNLYKSLSNKDVELAKSVFSILEKAQEVVAKSETFKAKGSDQENTNNAGNAWAQIEKAAEELIAKGLTKEKAVDQVVKEKPELYENYLNALKQE